MTPVERECTEPDYEDRWESIYRSGAQLNLYPHDLVVSWFAARFPDPDARARVRVLDLGCGAGNNLWFLARAGFQCAGLDISVTAVDFARNRLRCEGLSAQIEVGSFTTIPFATASFDVVLDRGGLAAVDFDTASKALAEVTRVLRPAGTLLFTPFAEGTRIDGSKGRLIGHLWKRGDVESVLRADAWRILRWSRIERSDELGSADVRVEWWIEAQRVGSQA